MLTNDVELKAMQGDVFRFTVLPHEDLTGLLVRGDIRSGGTLLKRVDTVSGGIVLGTYDPVALTTLVTVTVGASTTATWTFATARFDVEVVPADAEETHKIAKGNISLMTEETHD
jgi:hypothetical protein